MSKSLLETVENGDGLLTVKEVAELLDLSPKTVYGMVKTHSIPSLRFGGAIKFERKTLGFWLRKKEPMLALADRAYRDE